MAVMQALLGFTSEARWLRNARAHLDALFPSLPSQSGYTKGLCEFPPTMSWLVSRLAAVTSVADDAVWLSTPPRLSVTAPERPPAAATWSAEPSTVTAPPTPASSGGCACTWSPPCTGSLSPRP